MIHLWRGTTEKPQGRCFRFQSLWVSTLLQLHDLDRMDARILAFCSVVLSLTPLSLLCFLTCKSRRRTRRFSLSCFVRTAQVGVGSEIDEYLRMAKIIAWFVCVYDLADALRMCWVLLLGLFSSRFTVGFGNVDHVDWTGDGHGLTGVGTVLSVLSALCFCLCDNCFCVFSVKCCPPAPVVGARREQIVGAVKQLVTCFSSRCVFDIRSRGTFAADKRQISC